jgi:hypothetical protein
MWYHIKIRKAGTLLEEVTVEANSVLTAIELLDADHEKFTVLLSDGPGHLITAHWSGYEYEAREVPVPS